MAAKKYRVLVGTHIDSVRYESNDVVLIDEKIAKQHVEIGTIDASKEAVEYAEKELGAKAKEHAALVQAAE